MAPSTRPSPAMRPGRADGETCANTAHCNPRCGTSYLLLVMLVTVLVYSFFGWSDNLLLRLGMRLLMLPVIAGVAYEVLKLLAMSDCILVRALRWPGMQLQRLTTAEPTDEMIEIGILAFEMALEEKSQSSLPR